MLSAPNFPRASYLDERTLMNQNDTVCDKFRYNTLLFNRGNYFTTKLFQLHIYFPIKGQTSHDMHAYLLLLTSLCRHIANLKNVGLYKDRISIQIHRQFLPFLRPVYTGDFCRSNSMQFLSRRSCNGFKIARVNQLRFQRDFSCDLSQLVAAISPGWGGTPLCWLYGYVGPQRVWFFSRFGHK